MEHIHINRQFQRWSNQLPTFYWHDPCRLTLCKCGMVIILKVFGFNKSVCNLMKPKSLTPAFPSYCPCTKLLSYENDTERKNRILWWGHVLTKWIKSFLTRASVNMWNTNTPNLIWKMWSSFALLETKKVVFFDFELFCLVRGPKLSFYNKTKSN